ncbi:MAG: flagellar hook-length control protein FliK [Sandaracinaceae bacterium]
MASAEASDLDVAEIDGDVDVEVASVDEPAELDAKGATEHDSLEHRGAFDDGTDADPEAAHLAPMNDGGGETSGGEVVSLSHDAAPRPRVEEGPRAPAPVASPMPREEVAEDGAARWTAYRTPTGESRARVLLDHPVLGELRMDFALEDGSLDVRVLASSALSAIRLERDEARVRELLQKHGARLGAMRVEAPTAERPAPSPTTPAYPRGRLSLTA